MVHGGDIYRNKVNIDFSVSVNPLGVPKSVKEALMGSVGLAGNYPDLHSVKLVTALAERFALNRDNIVCGNGASELIMAAVAAFKPETAIVPEPCFGGYERALQSSGCVIKRIRMKEEGGFIPDEDLIRELEKGADMMVIANPNNPTGRYIPKELLELILEKCEQKGICVLLDECFMELSSEPEKNTCISDISKWNNLIILRSFTKTFAIPGVRLGYAVCTDTEKIEKIKRILPEWNVSVAAQLAGEAAVCETEYIQRSREYINTEREFLADSLAGLGFRVEKTDSNFLLFYSESGADLYAQLLSLGILIRDCSSFEGLSDGWYRLAVKTHEENMTLINAIKSIGQQK